MFRLFDKFVSIRQYAFDEKGRILANSKNEIIDIKSYREIFSVKEDLQEIYYSSPFFFINDINGNGFFLHEKSIKKIENTYILGVLSETNILVEVDEATFLYSIKNQTLDNILDFSIFNFFVFDDFLFYEKDKFIFKKVISTKKNLWDFNCSEIINSKRMHEFIDVFKKQVLISCSSSIIISLNVETGELIYEYNLAEEFPNLQPYLEDDPAIAYFIREEEGVLIVLTRVALFHVNLHTHQVRLIKDYINLPKEQRWEFKAATIKENKAYFTGDLGQEYVAATRLGVLDVNTGEVLWQQQFKDKLYLPDAPQVSDDKLYVTFVNSDTVKKDLYIFEKEDVCF